jgi:4-amino-4-deoxy-L-arabinose transferase-like glycosyltransferase
LAENLSYSVSLGIPTVLRPPLTPIFFTGIIWLLGDHTLAVAFANWLVDAATCLILYFISLEIFQNKQVAVIAALLFVFYIPEIYYSWQAISEPLFSFLLAAFVWSFLRSVRFPSESKFILTGFLLGLVALTRSTMLYFLPIALIIIAWLLRNYGKQTLKWASLFSVSFMVCITPWIFRNYLIFNELIPGDSNFGRTLYHSTFALDKPDFLQYHSSTEGSASLKKLFLVRYGVDYHDLPEPQFDQLATAEALQIIQQYPDRYGILFIVQFFRMWYFIEGPRAMFSYPVLLGHIILLGFSALTFLPYDTKRMPQAVFLVVLVLFINAGSAAVRTNVRYIVPVAPYLMVFAAFNTTKIVNFLSTTWRNQQTNKNF